MANNRRKKTQARRSFTSDLGKKAPSGETLNVAKCRSASSSEGALEWSQTSVLVSANTANSTAETKAVGVEERQVGHG
jgi:hypothetical protein